MNRKILAVALGLIALPVFAASNVGDGPKGDGERRCEHGQGIGPMQMMKDVLSLRDDQVEPVNKIFQEQREARHALERRDREAHKALHEQTVEKMRAVLDEQQLGKFIAFTQGMHMARQHMHKMGMPGEHGMHGGDMHGEGMHGGHGPMMMDRSDD